MNGMKLGDTLIWRYGFNKPSLSTPFEFGNLAVVINITKTGVYLRDSESNLRVFFEEAKMPKLAQLSVAADTDEGREIARFRAAAEYAKMVRRAMYREHEHDFNYRFRRWCMY